MALSARPVGAFTPAVSDPRLAAALARRGTSLNADFRFTPAIALGEHSRHVQVAFRSHAVSLADAQRVTGPTSASPVTAITPSSYNLGVSLGWRRFAISGEVAQADAGLIQGGRESAQVGMSYRATHHITGRVALATEHAQGDQRILGDDQAVSFDVGGAYSIARNFAVTAGARYRIARDRIEPFARVGPAVMSPRDRERIGELRHRQRDERDLAAAPAGHVVLAPPDLDHLASLVSSTYIASICAAYFCATTLRLIFKVGVSSPESIPNGRSRIANFFTCSTRASVWLT
jgi:hypothetical protein